MSYENMTVAQLRDEVRRVYTYEVDTATVRIPATSKLRKAELVDLLVNAPRLAPLHEQPMAGSPAAVAQAEEAPVQTITVPTVGTFEANEFLAFVGSALAEGLSEQDQRDLDNAKLRGRFLGKSVMVQVGTRHDKLTGDEVPNDISGKVTGGTHRDADPTGRTGGTLLLAVQHEGHPRVTLHRAEDVVLV